MKNTNNARHAEDLGNQRHDERKEMNGTQAANKNDTAQEGAETEDERALRLARAWRVGKADAWNWLVGRLVAQLEAGRTYASMRQLTDELSQAHDLVDDSGRKVTVPHARGVGRGLALLMVEECPEFGRLLRMRGVE